MAAPRRQRNGIEAQCMNRREFNRALLAGAGTLAFAPARTLAGSALEPRINGERINRHIRELAEFGKNPQGGVSRVAYTEFDRQGRALVMRLMRDAGLQVSVDQG